MYKKIIFSIVLMFFGTMSLQAQSDDGASDYTNGIIAASQKNYSAAIQHYQKAFEKGHAEAAMAIGDLYFKGDGVVQNDAKAKK